MPAPAHGHPSLLLRRLPLAGVLAWRYLRGQRSQILSSTALAALFATGLGVTAMVVAMALMTGYTEDLQRKLIGLQGDIIASPLTSEVLDSNPEALERTSELGGVRRLGRVAYGEGSLSSPAVPGGAGVVLRGVDPGPPPGVLMEVPELSPEGGAPEVLDLGADDDGVASVVLGKELARQLEAGAGDVVRLVVLSPGEDRVRFRYRSVRVAGTFTTGFAEFDARWVLLDRDVLRKARGDRGLDVMEVDVAAGADPDAVVERVERTLGPQWIVQRWESLNQQLFAALRLQELLLFLVLGLIVLVSTFNTSSTLVILVRERLPDIGVLASLGLSPRQLWGIFIIYGMGLGLAGTALGVAAGVGVAWVMTEFELIRFDPEVAAVYFIDSVPFRVEATDVAAIVAFSLAVTFLACARPALRAARLQPADALRDP